MIFYIKSTILMHLIIRTMYENVIVLVKNENKIELETKRTELQFGLRLVDLDKFGKFSRSTDGETFSCGWCE